jgi:hypothetical protein
LPGECGGDDQSRLAGNESAGRLAGDERNSTG